ncbi:ferritin-like domain-containing protein [Salinarimonas chemoclinalis]|uniref:ferritin-like domain-containing protein n=1 Tax=Salinarimonas chemoclinalis TaxID=3241599 RepID=UPI00355908C3
MKGPDVSLKHLQRAITMELTTVNTYELQAAKLRDWGVDQLADRMGEEIEEERGHFHRFLDRLLFLEGTANVHDLDPIGQDDTIRAMFETQLKMENEARAYYDKAAKEARDAGDLGTFDLFRSILKDEEEHIDFVETQFDLMELMGEQLYVSRQVSSVKEQEEDD